MINPEAGQRPFGKFKVNSLAIGVFLIVVVGIIAGVGLKLESMYKAAPFSRKGWDGFSRASMIVYFQYNKKELLGLTRNEVLNKLGEPAVCGSKVNGGFEEGLVIAPRADTSQGTAFGDSECFIYRDMLDPWFTLVLYFDRPGVNGRVVALGGREVHSYE